MKTVILNGSPRRMGNSAFVAKALEESMISNIASSDVAVLNVNEMKLEPCQACEGCKETNGRCVHKDDTNHMVEQIIEADNIVFVTPVYCFGMTGQMKVAIDKQYCMFGRKDPIKPKKLGNICIGGAATSSIQYGLMARQFEEIYNYIGWDTLFSLPISASGSKDVKSNVNIQGKVRDLYRYF